MWSGILRCWSLRYLGHPECIPTDQGSNFVATSLQHWAGEAGITLYPVAVEASSSMGTGERIHGPLRRTVQKLRLENPTVSLDMLLDVATKAHNDSAGVNGLVPTVLVYGTWPKLPLRDDSYQAATHSARARMRITAMTEYQKSVDEARSKFTQNCQAPTVPLDLQAGDLCLTWRSPLKQWTGPHRIVSAVPNGYYVLTNCKQQLHRATSVRRYVEGVVVDALLPPRDALEVDLQRPSHPEDDSSDTALTDNRAADADFVNTAACEQQPQAEAERR